MFTVKMITNVDIIDTDNIFPKGTIMYEEDFNNLNEIDSDGFLGKDFTVEIINNNNQSTMFIQK